MNNSGNKEIAARLKEFENLEPLQAGAGWEQELFARISRSKEKNTGKKEWRQYAVVIALFLALNTFLFLRAGKEGSSQQEERTGILDTVSDQLLIHSTASK